MNETQAQKLDPPGWGVSLPPVAGSAILEPAPAPTAGRAAQLPVRPRYRRVTYTNWRSDGDYSSYGTQEEKLIPDAGGDLVGSLVGDDLHLPVLDIDFPVLQVGPDSVVFDVLMSEGSRYALARGLNRLGLLRDAHVGTTGSWDLPRPRQFTFMCPVTAVSSKTAGHSHLYLDAPLTFWAYKRMLKAFVDAGLVEPSWARAVRRAREGYVHVG